MPARFPQCGLQSNPDFRGRWYVGGAGVSGTVDCVQIAVVFSGATCISGHTASWSFRYLGRSLDIHGPHKPFVSALTRTFRVKWYGLENDNALWLESHLKACTPQPLPSEAATCCGSVHAASAHEPSSPCGGGVNLTLFRTRISTVLMKLKRSRWEWFGKFELVDSFCLNSTRILSPRLAGEMSVGELQALSQLLGGSYQGDNSHLEVSPTSPQFARQEYGLWFYTLGCGGVLGNSGHGLATLWHLVVLWRQLNAPQPDPTRLAAACLLTKLVRLRLRFSWMKGHRWLVRH